MDQHLEVIGAFIDGERVNGDALRAALAMEEGRAYLVELAAMREIVAMPPATTPAPGASTRSATFLVAAAVLTAAVGAAGFALGTRRAESLALSSAQRAPQPTKVLKLETGVNWNENQTAKGGN